MPKIICIGRNYADHAKELKNDIPKEPVIFMKPDSAILPKGRPFFIPNFSEDVHYECELLVRINRLGKRIEKQFAHKYYNQISLGIDFTARDIQQELKLKGLPWEKAKGFDGSAVIGKWVDKNEYDLNNLSFELYQNNNKVQEGNTKDMLFSVDEIITQVSQYFTLKIGDIIFTGTPAGVGKVNINDELSAVLEGQELLKLRCK
jgi:2-keto-4-pentenoate hydratase/2-oxohepta-3-ene-1,7-dioic acid hydratase in catechol pathway